MFGKHPDNQKMADLLDKTLAELLNNIIIEENKLKFKRKTIIPTNVESKRTKELNSALFNIKLDKKLIQRFVTKIISLNSILLRKTLRDLLINLNYKFKNMANNNTNNKFLRKLLYNLGVTDEIIDSIPITTVDYEIKSPKPTKK